MATKLILNEKTGLYHLCEVDGSDNITANYGALNAEKIDDNDDLVIISTPLAQ